METASKFTFTLANPPFVKVLNETTRTLNIDAEAAIDTIFKRTYRDLRRDYIWISSQDIYKNNSELFSAANNALCPCITSSVKQTDLMQQVIAALERCSPLILNDSLYVQKMRTLTSGKTTDELNKQQQSFAIFVFENCDIIYYKFIETIFRYPVFDQFYRDLSNIEIAKAESAIKYFNAKQLDSLRTIFPGYARYIKELNKATLLLKQKDARMLSSYRRMHGEKMPKTTVGIFYVNEKLAEITFTASAQQLDSKIEQIKFHAYPPEKNGKDVIDLKVKIPK